MAAVSMATAEVKLGGSQLLVKHTTKLWLRDKKETNAAPYKQNWFLLPMEAQERDFQTILQEGGKQAQQGSRAKE